MAFELTRTKSLNAAVDLTGNQFRFVRMDSAGKLNIPATAADAIGVLQDKPNVGDPGAVCTPGDYTKVVLGGTVAAGQYVSSDNAGRAVVATSGAFVLGQVLFGGAIGNVVTMLFEPQANRM